MKKYLVAFLLALFALPLIAQEVPSGASPLHRVGGTFYASAYNTWRSQIIVGNSATGSQAITVGVPNAGPIPGLVTLRDGYAFVPYAVNETLLVGIGANQETVTVSAVSNCPPAGPVNPVAQCTLTATFANTHGAAEPIFSASAGIQEAIQDAANNGGGLVYIERDCGNVVLNTGGATTTITACTVPLNILAAGASTFVTTTITTTASYSLGIAGTTTLWYTACTALTAGLNCSAFSKAQTESASTTSFALTPVLITANAASGAGAVHVKVYGYVQVQSNN